MKDPIYTEFTGVRHHDRTKRFCSSSSSGAGRGRMVRSRESNPAPDRRVPRETALWAAAFWFFFWSLVTAGVWVLLPALVALVATFFCWIGLGLTLGLCVGKDMGA